MAYYRALTSGGSGGSGIVTGETATVTAKSEDLTIDTGLSSVKRFWAIMYLTNWNPSYVQMLWYDADNSTTTFSGGCVTTNSNAYNKANVSLGTNATTYGASVVSVSGGTVTIKTASYATEYAGVGLKFKWYAE